MTILESSRITFWWGGNFRRFKGSVFFFNCENWKIFFLSCLNWQKKKKFKISSALLLNLRIPNFLPLFPFQSSFLFSKLSIKCNLKKEQIKLRQLIIYSWRETWFGKRRQLFSFTSLFFFFLKGRRRLSHLRWRNTN